ncbi:MAG: FGGY family carbohydrate kinase [Rhodospirillales bacterium]|nr:FGGY family carbohydrate kinase [Rhodospirillales bacterium]
MTAIAVLDIGKTNVKLSATEADGTVLETLGTPNVVLPAPPYRHHDVIALEEWLLGALAELGRRHAIATLVPVGHGSAGVLVDEAEPVLPMIDYEDEPPAAVTARYRALAGDFRTRGSPIMLGASHVARQMLWLQTGWPGAFARARHFLALPQYWAWRLCGVAASEATTLGAQSHLWSPRDGAWSPIVAARKWQRLLPPLAPAWAALGRLHPGLAARAGLPRQTRVLCGAHDSSVNFYRYQAAGLAGLTVVSTGTWIVALSDAADPDALDEARGMTCNADPAGRALAGALCMGGREFALIAGAQPPDARGDAAVAARLVARGTLPLPFFGDDDALLPGRAGRGAILGPPPQDAAERRALALIATALLTDLLLDAFSATGLVVLDGSFVADALYPALVAALRPQAELRCNRHRDGVAAGAALLAGHATRSSPASLALDAPAKLDFPGLATYRARWRALAASATE